jgi:hypothetical protein
MQTQQDITATLTKFGYSKLEELDYYEETVLSEPEGRLRHASWHFDVQVFAPALLTLPPDCESKTLSYGGNSFKNPFRMNMRRSSAMSRMHRAQKLMYPDLYTSVDGSVVLKAPRVAAQATTIHPSGNYTALPDKMEVNIESDHDSEDEDEIKGLVMHHGYVEHMQDLVAGTEASEDLSIREEQQPDVETEGAVADNEESMDDERINDEGDEAHSSNSLFSGYDDGDRMDIDHGGQEDVDMEAISLDRGANVESISQQLPTSSLVK